MVPVYLSQYINEAANLRMEFEPQRVRDSSLIYNDDGVHPVCNWDSLPGDKQLGREVEHSLPLKAEVKNVCS